MPELTTHILEEIADVQTGPFGSQLHMSDYKREGTPIITVEHLGENRIIHKNLPLVGEEDKSRLIKYTLKEGDIVFSRVGSVDRCAYVSEKEDGWMFSGRCLRVRTNAKVNSRFLSFYFNQESFKEYIRMIAVGATMPSINTTILSEVEINLPKLSEQKLIAETLSSLDDKIDLLHRQNKTLEALAETLFRRWFVDKKWNGTLSEYVKVQGGYAFKSKDFKENGFAGVIKIRNISMGSIDIINSDFVDEGVVKSIDKRFKIKTGDFLIAMTGAEIGKIGIVEKTEKEIWVNQRVGKLEAIVPYGDLVGYLALKSREGQEHIINACAGSAQENISSTGLEEMNFISYEKERTDSLGKEIQPLFEKIIFNQGQIKTLAQLRDALLPKLMSGEVSVI